METWQLRIRSGGFVGDKDVRGTRMADAWHEDGRQRWRRAARRDSCNARRSRALADRPGGKFGAVTTLPPLRKSRPEI